MEYPLSFAKYFANHTNSNIIYLEKGLIRPTKDPLPEHAHTFFRIIKNSIEKLNISIDRDEEEKLHSLWLEFYQYCHNYFSASLKHIRRYNISNFVAQSIGNIEVRTYALAVRFNGGTVYCFGHGHDIGMAASMYEGVISQIVSPISEFITRSTLMKTLMSHIINAAHDHNYNDIRIYVIPSDEKYLQRSPTKPVEKVKKVFIYEQGLMYRRSRGVSLHWPYQINLLRKIGKLFQKNKDNRSYSLHLKGNPFHFALTKKIYSDVYDSLIETRFEDVVHQADLLILPHVINTSSLIPALTSRAYIIIFKAALKHCWKEIIPLLESRCMVLDSWREPDDSISFDQEQLLEFIENPRPFKPWVTP